MKDIDFDELDRAVASALSRSHSSERSAIQTPVERQESVKPETRVDRSSTPAATSSISAHNIHSRMMPSRVATRTPILRQPSSAADTADAPVPAPDTPVASDNQKAHEVELSPAKKRTIPHRSGRFMDVVASGKPPSKQVSRISRTIATPFSQPSAVSSDVKKTTDVVVPAASSTHESLDSAIDEVLKNESIEAPATLMEEVPKLTLPPATQSSEVESDDLKGRDMPESYETDLTAVDDMAKDLEQPLVETVAVSPFLLDAKVEKRPLGGASESIAAPSPDVAAPVDVPHSSERETHVAISNDLATPAELDDKLVAIESTQLEIPKEHVSVDTNPTPKPESKSVSLEKPASAATGPTFITRQYREAPRVASEKDESGAIFDPGTYQTTIEHPSKKSSGWGWVIAIISLVLLGVVGAVLLWMEGILPTPL